MIRSSRFVATLAAMSTASISLADQKREGLLSYDHMNWNGGFGMGGGLMMLIFLGVIIFLIVVAVHGFTRGKPEAREPDAMEILKQRFAKGEIDEDEFQKRKYTLNS